MTRAGRIWPRTTGKSGKPGRVQGKPSFSITIPFCLPASTNVICRTDENKKLSYLNIIVIKKTVSLFY
jgi:hypothetical protein